MRTSLKHLRIKKAIKTLKAGGIIAYPTEGVFGLGCDPFNPAAVHKLLQIKQRSIAKGLVLIASDWEYIKDLVGTVSAKQLMMVKATWPGPYTWVFPANDCVPPWIRGNFETVALRITDHPIANALCKAYAAPIVSTSANIAGKPPLIQVEQVREEFFDKLDFILPGRVGNLSGPTEIRDVITGQILREI